MRRKGKTVIVKDEKGNVTKKLTLHKKLPKGCKVAKRICIECLKNVIRKNDLNYDLKVCKECIGNRCQY